MSATAPDGFGQWPQVIVTKKACTFQGKYTGQQLFLEYRSDSVHVKSDGEYWLKGFIHLPDTVKLLLIEKLLQFAADTAQCCVPVLERSFNGMEGCRYPQGIVERYPIQVEALFLINRLVWPKLMELYSCTPVLFDRKKGRVINDQPRKIRKVYKEYKRWFGACKAEGKISPYFPFNTGRYIWYGGRKSIAPKKGKSVRRTKGRYRYWLKNRTPVPRTDLYIGRKSIHYQE
ncbi:MAG TPA: hypothetical protein VHK69_05080 [Chitinophagaceae bacterium]|nr:hypothetical protein [Chitinophagaceae bacterium]